MRAASMFCIVMPHLTVLTDTLTERALSLHRANDIRIALTDHDLLSIAIIILS